MRSRVIRRAGPDVKAVMEEGSPRRRRAFIHLAAIRRAATPWLAMAALATGAAPALASPPDPVALYGRELLFDVHRNGARVGEHRVRFGLEGDRLTVESRFSVTIKVLFIPAYRYLYASRCLWVDGRLESVSAEVDDNGTRFEMAARREGSRFLVRAGDRITVAPSPLFPTNHWNVHAVGQERLLNTLTGRVNAVRYQPLGRERVRTERGEVPALRYAITGDLRAEVWYDDAGRWVKMRFAGKDGTPIDYVCRRCQGPAPGEEAP